MRSLREQLTLGLLVTFALILGGGGSAIYIAMKDQLYEQFDRSLVDKAGLIMTQTLQRETKLVVYFSDFILRAFDDDVATEFFQVWDGDGKAIERSDSLGSKDLPLRFGPQEAPLFWDLHLPNGEPGRAIGLRFNPRVERRRTDGPRPEAIIVVAAGRDELIESLRDLRVILVSTVFGALMLSAFAVWALLRRNLAPVDEVAQAAARIDAESLDQRLPVETLPIELQPLAGKLNALLTRLQASFERERRFSSDLAHELRTPVAELRSIAEVALTWPDERTVETDQTILQIAHELESRVNTLLALARAEQGTLQLEVEPVEPGVCCHEVLRPLESRIRERDLDLQIAGLENGGTVETDPVIFRSVVENLLSNATEYAPRESPVRIELGGSGSRFRLTVANQAPDLQPSDVEHLFNRFWRKDAARSGHAHAGLGLSLAQTYAELLGHKLEAELEGGHLRITFSGPRRAPPPV